jgi:hypothetical protein
MTSTLVFLWKNRQRPRPFPQRRRVGLAKRIIQAPAMARICRRFSKPIVIDDCAWIATGATLLPGAWLGRGAVVGAGAVVACHVPDYALAIGNPAKLTIDRRAKNLSYDPANFAAPYEAWIGRNASLKAAPLPDGA